MKKFETRKSYPGVRREEGETYWSFRIQIDKKAYTGSGYKTAKEAFEAKEQLRQDIRNTGSSDILTKKTFDDVYREYYEAKKSLKSYATLKKYESNYKHHIYPVFGNKKIKGITKADIDRFLESYNLPKPEKKYGEMHVYSRGYINGLRKLLKNVFQYAIDCNYVSKNPVCSAKDLKDRRIGIPPEEGKYIPPEDIAKIENRLKNLNTYPAFRISCCTGMRIGEVFGLCWEDIDFRNYKIHVRRQMVPVVDKGVTVWCLAKLKTESSKRDIIMDDQLHSYLLYLKGLQHSQREQMGDNYIKYNKIGELYKDEKGNDVVSIYQDEVNLVNRRIVGGRYGERLTPSSWKRANQIINKELKIEGISFHDFRHTHCCNCSNTGMDPAMLKNRMGHSKIETTMAFYQHDNEAKDLREMGFVNTLKMPELDKFELSPAVQAQIQEELFLAQEL